jgi:hypothetical protein
MDGRLSSASLPPGAYPHHEEHPTGPSAVIPSDHVDPVDESDLVPDESTVALRREMRRRVGNPDGPATDPGSDSRPTSGGRHSRRDSGPRPARLDYVPRHAIRTPGPAAEASPVSPSDLTEVFPLVRRDPLERPRAARPESEPIVPARAEPPTEAPADLDSEPAEAILPGKRVRVVLSSRKGQARPVRTVVDVRELTHVGEVLSSSLIRSQLGLALRIGGIALIALGALPAMFAIFPVLGRIELFGMRLPWLVLGVLAYPFLLALGWMYSRSAEKLEQVFADHIQD